MIALVWIHRIL